MEQPCAHIEGSDAAIQLEEQMDEKMFTHPLVTAQYQVVQGVEPAMFSQLLLTVASTVQPTRVVFKRSGSRVAAVMRKW